MTALCGGGSSAPKPLTQPVIAFGGAAVATFIRRITGRDIDAVAGLIAAGLAVVSAQYCGTDPPPDPQLTEVDWLNIFRFDDASIQIPATQRFSQWFLHRYWWEICECVSVVTPSPPPLSDPGPVGVNTGIPAGGASTCYEAHPRLSFHSGTATTILEFTPQTVPVTGPAVIVPATGMGTIHNVQAVPIPTGIDSYNYVATYTSAPITGADSSSLRRVYANAQGQLLSDSSLASNTTNTPNSVTKVGFQTGTTHWAFYNCQDSSLASGQELQYSFDMSFNCTGPNFSSPCCPPDPLIQGELSALIGRVNEIWALMTAGQQHGAYVDSVRHSNLSGNGTIQIEPSSVAVRLEVKTDLTSWPHNPQTPNYFYSLGFITPYAVGTPLRGQRLIYDRQTFTWPSYTDQVGFSFSPGIVADLVELIRSP